MTLYLTVSVKINLGLPPACHQLPPAPACDRVQVLGWVLFSKGSVDVYKWAMTKTTPRYQVLLPWKRWLDTKWKWAFKTYQHDKKNIFSLLLFKMRLSFIFTPKSSWTDFSRPHCFAIFLIQGAPVCCLWGGCGYYLNSWILKLSVPF